MEPLRAGVAVGLIWDLWHLPLWLMTGYVPGELVRYVVAFTVAIVALSVLTTWVYLRASRSLAPMVVTHFAFNIGISIAGPDGLGLAPTLPLLEGTAVLLAAAAAAVWVLGGRGRPAR